MDKVSGNRSGLRDGPSRSRASLNRLLLFQCLKGLLCGLRTRKWEVTLDFPKRRPDHLIVTKVPEKTHHNLEAVGDAHYVHMNTSFAGTSSRTSCEGGRKIEIPGKAEDRANYDVEDLTPVPIRDERNVRTRRHPERSGVQWLIDPQADLKNHRQICARGAGDFSYPNYSTARRCLELAVLERRPKHRSWSALSW
jgi:hypothetical protein